MPDLGMSDRRTLNVIPEHSDRSACLLELRRRIAMIERDRFAGGPADEIEPVPGEPTPCAPSSIDPFLAGRSRMEPALQELVADDYGSRSAVRDFGLTLIASLLHRRREHRDLTESRNVVLWCDRQRDALEFGQLYGPGLQGLGLPPNRLLMVSARRDADCLWAMEQGLASNGLLAVVGMVDRATLTASRRLSLAARAHGTWCLLLPLQHGKEPSAARTRWRVRTASSTPDMLDPKGLGLPSWELALERSENGSTGRWIVEWDHGTHHFHLAASRRDGLDQTAGQNGPDKVARQGGDIVAFDRTG